MSEFRNCYVESVSLVTGIDASNLVAKLGVKPEGYDCSQMAFALAQLGWLTITIDFGFDDFGGKRVDVIDFFGSYDAGAIVCERGVGYDHALVYISPEHAIDASTGKTVKIDWSVVSGMDFLFPDDKILKSILNKIA